MRDYKEVILTEDELRQKCAEWQKIMGLQDWYVKAFVMRNRDMSASDKQGECEWNMPNKTAVIRLLDPIDRDQDIFIPYDMEITLVHELMHLHMCPFDNFSDSTLECKMLEQAVEATAHALVWLSRKAVL